MPKKAKYSVHFSKEYIIVAEDHDQAVLKTQQFLNIPMKIFRELNLETTEIDMEYERICGRKLYDGVDIK